MLSLLRRRVSLHLPLLFVALAGCASVQKTVERPEVDSRDERIVSLSERLERQERLLHRLREQIGAMRTRPPAVSLRRHRESTPQIPVTKIRPNEPSVPTEEMNAEEVGTEDEVVVDSSENGMHFYFKGLRLFRDAAYDPAVQAFQHFLENGRDHVYADRAQYLITEAHFLNHEFSLAILAASQMQARYPDSLRMPEALYRRAASFAGLGQKENAKVTLRDWLQAYPRHPLAAEISRQLASLDPAFKRNNPPPVMEHEPNS